ncbi:MAG TPA: tetratricopeptide repeat protein [Bryobacteraceae bacterium]|jgi:tetratricopeptide (TPR) repeat protein|nr:tetratricopeptide repeat protein [Bryobacteraceae bacterium]
MMFRLFAGILGALAVMGQPLPSEARVQERIKKYEELTRDNPRDVEFWHILGGHYRDAELWDKAIGAETQAVQRFPKYAVAYYGRGKARVGKEDYAGAVEDFTSSIKLYEARGGLEMYLTVEQPSAEYIDCYRTRGIALSHLNKLKEGIGDVSTAIKLRKDDPKLLYERGYLEEKAGLKKEAIPDYHRAGLIYADAFAKAAAQECVTRLDGLGAKTEADAVRLKLAPKTKKSDLPN